AGVKPALGGTGGLFAVDPPPLNPALRPWPNPWGGGLGRLGPIPARRALWHKAYGDAQTFALHSSTFGGGSLACAAALATLDVLVAEDLPAQAAARGRELLAGLESICLRYPVVREVRGQGLLLGVEFQPISEKIL